MDIAKIADKHSCNPDQHRKMPSHEQEIEQIKARIAAVYARRERLKQELETGAVAPRDGFARLDQIDRELSELDSRFKQLWDLARSGSIVPHPASKLARRVTDPEAGCRTSSAPLPMP